MNYLQRFNTPARNVLTLAQNSAADLKHNYVGTEHLLIGLIRESSGVAAKVMSSLGLNEQDITARVKELTGATQQTNLRTLTFTPRSSRAFELAVEEARRLNSENVGTAHLLLGIIQLNEGVAADVLKSFGVMLESLRQHLLNGLLSGDGEVDGDTSTSQLDSAVESVMRVLSSRNADHIHQLAKLADSLTKGK
jgi:ATP-dependent Clp protease ATP-binding subunit ClpC